MEKPDLIGIKEMKELFGVSRTTIYEKYKPYLEHIPTTDNKVFFSRTAAIALHKKIKADAEEKKRKGVCGNYSPYKEVIA